MNRWLGCFVGLSVVCAAQAQVRPPANPLQTLPQTQAPKQAPSVNVTVQQQRNPALEALLASRLTPTRFDVQGAKAVPFETVAAIFRPLQGRDVSVADLIAAADKVTALYKEKGYALSFAFIPGQDFSGGVVRVDVVEGYVAEVTVKGDTGTLDKRIRRIAAHIVGERPLKQATFERYIQVLGQLPGAKIAASVPPPTTTDGATRLDLNVTRQRYNATSGLDMNHPGTQGVVALMENALTPLGEQVSVSTLFPSGGRQKFYSASWIQPFGSNGWQGEADISNFRGNPDNGESTLPAYLDHRLDQDKLSFSAHYPIILSNTRSLVANGGIYASDQNDKYRNVDTGALLALQSHTRVVNASLAWVATYPKQTRQFSVEVAHGFNGLGAYSRALTNIPGADASAIALPDVTFTRIDMSFAQTNQWPHQFGTVISATGQYSNNTLPSTEQINFGGPRYALAYDPGDAAGDSGWAGALEVNRKFVSSIKWVSSLVPYVVGQMARVYVNSGRPLIRNLDSVALGLRASDGKHYTIDLAFAQPVGDKPPEDHSRSTRVNLTFSYRLK
ncbi:hemolysin activation/secretion protein [Luteibacter sp. Sphag1AF]|uniref:ShlB/FhaC/HecB family hemolysin secretion/activation protein n=1 Tax=Luteibacter sp. Sphag1AF TaxID=2587031 RepID=UPI001608AA85|nr:ShlB/FhaC/HecB family hemolysin secretion/activation protein [Luteibacter sp. Sphag1AF]MBB3228928.1 hemolysin activation/secretion protein [Luteibacter sp. Sphag1AF]